MSWKATVDVYCDKCSESFDDEDDVIYCCDCYEKLEAENSELEDMVEDLKAEVKALNEKLEKTGGLQSE